MGIEEEGGIKRKDLGDLILQEVMRMLRDKDEENYLKGLLDELPGDAKWILNHFLDGFGEWEGPFGQFPNQIKGNEDDSGKCGEIAVQMFEEFTNGMPPEARERLGNSLDQISYIVRRLGAVYTKPIGEVYILAVRDYVDSSNQTAVR